MIDLTGQLPRHASKVYSTRSLEEITRIVLHHTAGPADQTPEAIARWHVEGRDWPGIGYHYLVGPEGAVYKCQLASVVTHCVANGNTPSLCVALIGDFTHAPPPAAQWEAALDLVAQLARAYGIQKIYGHREVPTDPPQQTECPGARFNYEVFRLKVSEGRKI